MFYHICWNRRPLCQLAPQFAADRFGTSAPVCEYSDARSARNAWKDFVTAVDDRNDGPPAPRTPLTIALGRCPCSGEGK